MRPTILPPGGVIELVGNRHAVVEAMEDVDFIANDICLNPCNFSAIFVMR